MTLEVSGLEQNDQPSGAGEVLDGAEATAQAVPVIEGVVVGARSDRSALGDEILADSFPDLPDHAVQYLRSRCNEAQLPFALREASQLDPLDLEDAEFAPLFLDPCINQAEIAALAEAERAQSTEIADRQEQVTRNDETIADVQEERAEVKTRVVGETNREDDLEQEESEIQAEIDRMYSEEAARGGGVDTLIRRVSDRLGEVDAGPERDAAFVKLNQVRATLDQMRSVVTNPEERAAFEQILSTASLNLGGDSSYAVFSDVMAQVDASEAISDETKASIRASTGAPEVNTGSQAQNLLRETRVDEQGRTVPVWSEGNPLPVRDGLEMYSDSNQRQIMRTEFNGHIVTIDTTGWSGGVVGKYLEAMSFIRDVESYGGTGLFQSIYRIDFNLTGEEGFDMHKVDQILNIMGKWFGGFEHADGDVRQNGDRRGFIRYVVRLLNKRGTATGFEESQADTDEVLRELGLRNSDGSPNWKQIDRLGDFARSTYLNGDADYEDLKEHLVGRAETN